LQVLRDLQFYKLRRDELLEAVSILQGYVSYWENA